MNRLHTPIALLLLAFGSGGCAPKLSALPGTPAPVALPTAEIPRGYSQIVFDWDYSDQEMKGKGNGVARIAGPDSARLDFFLAGGFAGGVAVLIGDTLQLPGVDLFRRLIPPPALLWATLGRTVFPVTRDTAIRRDGGLLRADLGKPVEWRATFRADSLIRLERVDGGRVVEWIDRSGGRNIEYRQEAARRTLRLQITRVDIVTGFDASIWTVNR